MNNVSGELKLVLVWHMHQPDYRDRAGRIIQLPWVRLHALKDYYDMPARLEAFPRIHQTFNLVPSLVSQIEDYLSGEWSEVELNLFLRPAADLTGSEKHAILDRFFDAPREKLIDPHPRYTSLLREARLRSSEDLVQHWREQEWRDLQFWRQISWIDPLLRDRDPELNDLFQQGQNFTEAQKEILLERMKFWMRESIEIYRRLQESGSIEVSVSPFYHPILPLLMNPESAREAMPDCPLPDPLDCHPEDARTQMERAIRFYEERFGRRPRGVWPSEGSVSQEVASLLRDLDILWFASDEEILARSIGKPLRTSGKPQGTASPDLYKPYQTLQGQGPIILFRDHHLSDLIGFEYQRWDPEKAADHFVARILEIRSAWSGENPPLVTVILDGENCWEYYDKDGGPFLDALYDRLSKSSTIRCLTVSEALENHPAVPLERLAAGSWINGDFHIWIGEEADRRAWSLLEKARRTLVEAEEEGEVDASKIQEAWEEIYVAEGSDWYWWFGDLQSGKQASVFDEMFRGHILRVYELLSREAPRELLTPLEIRSIRPHTHPEPTFLSAPLIDGRITHYYEWLAAARFDPMRAGSTMRTAEKTSIGCLYYGGDEEHFYLRVDPLKPLLRPTSRKRWELRIASPSPMRIRFIPTEEGYLIQKHRGDQADNGNHNHAGTDEWVSVPPDGGEAAERDIFEASLTWKVLEIDGAETLSFFVGFSPREDIVELTPSLSCLCMTIPGRGKTGRPWFP